MWLDYFDSNFFLKNLYPKEPDLKYLRVNNFSLSDDGTEVILSFDLPKPDNMPKKWEEWQYNAVVVELKFYELKKVMLNLNNKYDTSNFKISKESTLIFESSGRYQVSIEFGCGLIGKVSGYSREI